METELSVLSATFDREIGVANTLKELDSIRIRFLGRKGLLSIFYEKFGKLSKEERPKNRSNFEQYEE
jgi:phenylalanyl-tRNA synthetase alpha chain